MVLTRKQEEGLKIAVDRYKKGEKCTIISGYAGSGKTTLVRFIVEAIGIDENKVCYATFTGKASQVLLKKGNKNVSTLHKLLYTHYPTASGKFIRKPVSSIPYDIVVVDEVSMAPRSLIMALAKYPVHIICLGDPGQLPPVNKDEDNHLLDTPHIFLDEIVRQAQESEIIRLSMDIRAGNPILISKGTDTVITTKKSLNTGMLTWADQIICSTNNTRQYINNQMRMLLGRGDKPEDGDKIICTRNYWDIAADNGDPLVNGTIGYLDNSFETTRYLSKVIGKNIPLLCGNLETDLTSYKGLEIDKNMILTGDKTLTPKESYKLSRSKKFADAIPQEFLYAYAITCHKAQGSEWDKVLILEENFPFDKEEHKKWLYTACTRSANQLVLVKGF